jgi:hypothetical protein
MSLHAHNQADGQLKTLVREKKLNNENNTAGTGSGFEPAQGPDL